MQPLPEVDKFMSLNLNAFSVLSILYLNMNFIEYQERVKAKDTVILCRVSDAVWCLLL